MTGRDNKGKFTKGYTGGPGRPKKEREIEYQQILVSSVSLDDWQAIIAKAVQDAKRGDAVARKFLADYLIGPPVQKSENKNENTGELTIRIIGSDGKPH